MSTQTASASLNLAGSVIATNFGDDALPTITTIQIDTSCSGLKVTDARFSSPSAGKSILQPINSTDNLLGPYVSLSPTAADATYKIPLEVTYDPKDAQITEVYVGFSAAGSNISFSGTNVIGQTHATVPGKLSFSGLTLPPLSGSRVTGKVALYVKLKGTDVNGTSITSDPTEGGQVSFQGGTSFTPLYLAGDEAGLSARRYGGRDPGGDSWATDATINWLGSNGFRFDDISALHIAQNTDMRSVLNHQGHSDGQQIDLRYADGMGGYSDTLGGANTGAGIKAMLDAAASEVARNASQKPQLAQTIAWINANRTLLSGQASAANTRRIYIGKAWMKLALVDGKFPDGITVIPQLSPTAWAKPLLVTPADDHLHHWHKSITAHP